MLSTNDNQMLTQVGPGTPMGNTMRHYWIPALLASELPDPKAPPLDIRLLGEDLTAFRTGDGSVGLVQTNCPHRGAPLYYGRPEDGGIRCAYHGWMFDTKGRCVDMPNEPEESNFKDKVSVAAYPCIERNGIVWTYMGAEATPPPLPDLEWNLVPEDHAYVTKRIQNCSFMQALEGEIDSSHSTFLHSALNNETFTTPVAVNLVRSKGELYRMQDKRPRFQVLDTDAGVMIGASYKAEEDSRYWRITQFLMPFHTLIPPYGASPVFSGHAWVPIDDTHTMTLCFTYHPARPLTQEHRDILMYQRDGLEGLHPTVEAFEPAPAIPGNATWRTKLKHEDHARFPIDWEFQNTKSFSGLPGVWPQDTAMQEGMGPIYNRSQEHLGTTDMGIIRVRRRLIEGAKALADHGVTPAGADEPAAYAIRAASAVVDNEGSWVDTTAEPRTVRLGVSDDTP
ncbi:MAG: Rieske 2Fe-2S domain-containing protein [Chloroflexi bacterium]|nr:Rieske 2Fe-2S domain-containing protein [Chloroflexota bacterium]